MTNKADSMTAARRWSERLTHTAASGTSEASNAERSRRVMLSALLIFASLAHRVFAQTTVVGDAWIGGRMAVGVSSATARLEVRASSASLAAFQISGVDETPFWVVNSTGSVGAGVPPLARLDVNGSADSGATGLMLRDGNMVPSSGGYQMAFGYNGTTNMRHAVETFHSTAAVGGSMDFYIWNTALSQSSIGMLDVLSLVVISSGPYNTASMHVRPAGTPTVQLEVSDGSTTGGGTIERIAEGQHSSRELKTNISYLGGTEEAKAYEEAKALKPAEFRYKSFNKKGELARNTKQPLRRGLIYEDAPDSVKGPGQSILIDERVNNLEMAMQEFLHRLDAAKAEADQLKAGEKR